MNESILAGRVHPHSERPASVRIVMITGYLVGVKEPNGAKLCPPAGLLRN
jgi:hypothetical protein